MTPPFALLPADLPIRPCGLVWIYALVDPWKNTVHYIGRTNDPERRLAEHIRDPELGRCHNAELERWIDDLARHGAEPKMVALEEATWDNWMTAERWWIKWARSRGHVYNIEDGGRSPHARKNRTPPKRATSLKPAAREPGRIDQFGIYRIGKLKKPGNRGR